MRAGTGSGKSRWKNPYQKMSAIETQDFQRRIQTLLRLKFPYESSFALLQLRHWLFCFDGGFKVQILHGTWSLCVHRCNIRCIICLIIASFAFFGENKKRQ